MAGDNPRSSLHKDLSRTLTEREPSGRHVQGFGQRFKNIHAGLRSLLNVGDGGSAEIKQSSKCNLGKSALGTHRGETGPHAVSRCRFSIGELFAESVP